MRAYMALVRICPALVLVGVSWGCGGLPHYEVVYRLDEGEFVEQGFNTIPSIELDLVMVKKADLKLWENLNIDHYWDPTKPEHRRRSEYKSQQLLMTIKFSEDDPGPHRLSRYDSIWTRADLRGARYLVNVANLPVISEGVVGSRRPRMIILPLDQDYWDNHIIELLIQPSQVNLTTPMLEVSE